MANYYFDKYMAVETYGLTLESSQYEQPSGGKINGHTGYSINEYGNPVGNGIYKTIYPGYSGETVYNTYSNKLYKYTNGVPDQVRFELYIYTMAFTGYKIGSLVQSNVIAEANAYPANDRHSDGYWYIRRNIVNTAPTMPGAFTQPTGTLEIGDSKAVTWGSSGDAESNLSKYVLEASINGGGWTVIAQPTSPTFTYAVPTATSVKFRVKAVDSNGLESAYRDSALLTVAKPMYYWSKYNVKKPYIISETPKSDAWFGSNTIGYSGMFFDTTTGFFTVSGYGSHPWTTVVYVPSGGVNNVSADKLVAMDANGMRKMTTLTGVIGPDAQGTLVQSNITATEGAYPTNGKHTDGFWYVRGSRVSQSIAPPGGFTTPAPNTTLLPKQALTLAFVASTAPSISVYEVEHRYNGGAWAIVGTHSNALTRPFTVTIDKALQNVEFRVRAKNTSNVYSDYVYSEAFTIQHNAAPTMTLSTTDSRTLYENDTYGIIGTATDTDSGNVVTVMYQIDGGEKRAILTHISTGAAIPFNLTLIFKGGMLYNGAEAVTPVLVEGGQHTLRVWAEDNQGGAPAEQTRVFYVVPNRPASLTINTFPSATDLINTDIITIGGSVADPDNGEITVKYKIANGSYTNVYTGTGGPFTFQLSLSALAPGANTITIQATDAYGAVTSKTLQIKKEDNVQPLKTAVVRYKLTPPNGTAKGALVWVEREVGDLVVSAEISMGASGSAENFVAMTKSATAFVSEGIEEDEFIFDAGTPKENIILKLTMTRTSTTSDKGITLISGVLS
ncbi:hypothetical protein FQ087_18205 [Sporosarcina sp. ANT_H38]|uniref:hypothetical protein n=1 Tax=Sporosarcina sp. ANT_H38 TaxID=2597358 RepID=UPI0011F22653|nr:hypothetical protein [Sporosarcina sp. ANT_H38]KAA0944059.1 hypothetical protein FQ087_18205 [Sporosarcina sp. ANT_H38]